MTLLVIIALIAGVAWAWQRSAERVAERRRNEIARRAERMRQQQFRAPR